jgi:hypothetical protein
VALANLDSNPRPEMVLMAYDNPTVNPNTFRYRVGKNISGHPQPFGVMLSSSRGLERRKELVQHLRIWIRILAPNWS